MKKVLLFLFLIYAQSLYSQKTKDSNNLIFGTIGVGGFDSKHSGGIDGLLSLDFQKKHNQWKIRYIGATEFYIFGPSPPESFNDIGVLYGRVANYKDIQFSISGGLGIVTGIMRGAYIPSSSGFFPSSEYEKRPFFTYGIPLEAEFSYNPLKFLGIGFAVYANINPESSLWGIHVMWKIGKLKPNRNFIQ
jgi:hypothetical protein